MAATSDNTAKNAGTTTPGGLHSIPDPILYSFTDSNELSEALAQFVVKTQDETLSKRDSFKVAVSGGSLPKLLGQNLTGRQGMKWEKWEIFFADERLVPLDHEDSNYRLVKEYLLDKVSIPADKVHTIDTSLLDDPEAVADDYEQKLMSSFVGKNAVAFPKFDLMLLGMGPDGHTCSLFPGHPLLKEDLRWVSWLDDSPKPPPTRITLTYPVLNHGHRAVFVVAGESKKELLSKVFDDRHGEGANLPCARVQPVNPGRVFWFTDSAASSHLKYKKSTFDPQESSVGSIKL